MLGDIINRLKGKLDSSTISGLNERNTDRVFVTPILEELGYDLANLDETVAGFVLKNVENSTEISYAFYKRDQLMMLLEIRPLYSDLSNEKHIARVLHTARHSEALILVITNGAEWQVFNSLSNEGSNYPAARIDIREPGAVEALSLLKMNSIGNGSLEEIKTRMEKYTEHQAEILSGPIKNRGYKISEMTHKNINHLRTMIMTNRDVKDQEITSSLIAEKILQVFFEGIQRFNYHDISNEVILKMRIEECLNRRFS